MVRDQLARYRLEAALRGVHFQGYLRTLALLAGDRYLRVEVRRALHYPSDAIVA